MNYQPGLPSQAQSQPSPDMVFRSEALPKTSRSRGAKTPALSSAQLTFRIFAAFRAHPHINNVLTHISGANWARVEQSLNRILDLATTSEVLSPLEQNIVDLMCADRGTTGRILKPYFHAVLHKLVEPDRAEGFIRHIDALFVELEYKPQQPARAAAAPCEPSPRSLAMREASQKERIIRVEDIDARHRHAILFRLFEHLAPDDSLQIVVDHDPRPLRLQLEARHGARCNWSYLEKGPDVWRVRLRLLDAGSADDD